MADGQFDKIKIALDIFYAIIYIKKIQHNKPSKEQVYGYLKKVNKDADFIEQLIKEDFIDVRGEVKILKIS